MALNKAALTTALAPTFKSQYYSAENDPEPGLEAKLPNSTNSVSEHQSACAANWKAAIDTYLAEMDPPHIPALDGTAGTKLQTELLSAFQTWFASDSHDCSLLKAAFVAMANEVFTGGMELHTGLTEDDWEWTLNVAPAGTPDLCELPSISENSSTPFTDGASIIAEKIHKWFITGTTTYTKTTNPAMGSTITYDWGGSVA